MKIFDLPSAIMACVATATFVYVGLRLLGLRLVVRLVREPVEPPDAIDAELPPRARR